MSIPETADVVLRSLFVVNGGIVDTEVSVIKRHSTMDDVTDELPYSRKAWT